MQVRFRSLLFTLLATWLTACVETPPPFRGTAVQDVEWGRSFVLTSHRGERFDTAALNGKVQVLFFGFTHCPDICAPTLAKLAQVSQALGDDRNRIQVLFITVDPDHDTPETLAKFLPAFDPGFIGLTGKAGELTAVAREHKIFSEGSGGAIAHTGNVLVKDRQGRVRLIIRETAPVQDIVHDLRLLLRT